jgi:hypothetical protein
MQFDAAGGIAEDPFLNDALDLGVLLRLRKRVADERSRRVQRLLQEVAVDRRSGW